MILFRIKRRSFSDNLSTCKQHKNHMTMTSHVQNVQSMAFPAWYLPPTCNEVTELIYSSKTFEGNFCSILLNNKCNTLTPQIDQRKCCKSHVPLYTCMIGLKNIFMMQLQHDIAIIEACRIILWV